MSKRVRSDRTTYGFEDFYDLAREATAHIDGPFSAYLDQTNSYDAEDLLEALPEIEVAVLTLENGPSGSVRPLEKDRRMHATAHRTYWLGQYHFQADQGRGAQFEVALPDQHYRELEDRIAGTLDILSPDNGSTIYLSDSEETAEAAAELLAEELNHSAGPFFTQKGYASVGWTHEE